VKQRIFALVITLILLFSFCSIMPMAQAQEENWTIESDTVFIDDSNVYLSATPHTLSGSGWVEFELLSKHFEGEIDVVWGFDQSEGVKPIKPQIWTENVAHTEYNLVDVEKENTLTIMGITDFTKLEWATFEDEPDVGNRNNTHLFEVTADFWDEDITETLVVAFNTYELDGDTATITYNYTSREREYYREYYADWKRFSISNFTRVTHSYKGCDDWHLTKLDASIKKDTTYKVRCWVEIPFKGTETVSGKYIWAVKPHNESIQDAMANGHLYVLDPWYSGSWEYRLEITIDHTKVDEDLAYFPVLITEANMTATFWANVNADGSDIVVTSDDAVTKLRRELVSIDNVGETMELWFRAPSLSSTVDDTFYLYFGNAGATEANSAYTWDTNYRAVWHKNDDPDNAHIVDSTDNGNDGDKAAANQPVEVAGQWGKAQSYDGTDDNVNFGNGASFPITDDISVGCWVKGAAQTNMGVAGMFDRGNGQRSWLIVTQGSGTAKKMGAWLSDDGSFDAGHRKAYETSVDVLDNSWHYFGFTFDASESELFLYIDGVVDGTPTKTLDDAITALHATTADGIIGARLNNGAIELEFTGLIDEVRISDEVRTIGWIGTTFNNQDDPTTFYSVLGEALTLSIVETNNADVDGTSATLNGEITDTGYPDTGDTDDERGFVWDTATHGDPGSAIAPEDTNYATSLDGDSWTEAGSFGTGDFDYEATGLTALVTYYYRACAHNIAGWTYGDEITFFALVDGNVYLEFRPDLDETRIRGNAGIPADILVEDMFTGYILPIYDADNQELFFIHCVPDRWDNTKDPVYASHILVHVDSSLTNANEANRGYRLQLAWDEVTPNEEEIPAYAPNIVDATRVVYSNTQYECYQDWFVILCNVDDGIEVDDLLALRLRRTLHTDDQKADNELGGDLIIHAVDILYARGDLLGDPEGTILTLINTWIEEGLLIGGESMIFFALIFLALVFTIASYVFKKGMLAFAGAGAWIITAIYCFIESTVAWDVYFSLAFLFIGLTIACFFSPLAWKETTMAGDRTEDPDTAEMQAEMAEFNKGRNQFSFLHSKGRPRRRSRW